MKKLTHLIYNHRYWDILGVYCAEDLSTHSTIHYTQEEFNKAEKMPFPYNRISSTGEIISYPIYQIERDEDMTEEVKQKMREGIKRALGNHTTRKGVKTQRRFI